MLQFLYGVFLGCCQLYKASLVAQLVKNPPAMPGDLGSIPALGKPPGEGKGYPLQYSGLENSMDFIVHGVTKSRTQLSDLHLRILSLAHHFGFFDLPIKSTSKPPPVFGFHFCRAVGFHDVFPRSTSKIHRSWDFSVRPLVSTNKLHWILLFWSIV